MVAHWQKFLDDIPHYAAAPGADIVVSHLDPCRFRPNIVVEATTGVEGSLEDDWLAGMLVMGESVQIVHAAGDPLRHDDPPSG